ncbi:MAG: hypothetical protein LBV33_05625, partial [Lachnospiraceae bacterium]|nr:hypothetical protein [Lachnospiraceae bacterium]
MGEIKRITPDFYDKTDTAGSVLALYDRMVKLDRMFLDCDEELRAAGMDGIAYISHADLITEVIEGLSALNAYLYSAHPQVEQSLDRPLWEHFKNHATETISQIKAEELTTENTLGVTEKVVVGAGQSARFETRVKAHLTLNDFI